MIVMLPYILVIKYTTSPMKLILKKDSNLEVNVGLFSDFYSVSVIIETKVLTCMYESFLTHFSGPEERCLP